MNYIFIDNIYLLSKVNILKSKKDFFLTNNPSVYKYLKINNIKVNLISEIFKPDQIIKLQSNHYQRFIKLLQDIDKDKSIKKFFFKNSKHLFYNSFRYLYAVHYSGLLTCVEGLNIIIRKKKLKCLNLYGEISNDIFDKSFLIDELKIRNSNLKIESFYETVKFKEKSFNNLSLKIFNSLNYDIFKNQLRKEVSKKKIFNSKKKNLIIEPMWDLFYYKYDVNKNLIINTNDILKNYSIKNNKINSKEITELFLKKKNKNFSKKILNDLISKAYKINQKSNFLISHINELFKKFNFEKIIWCNDPDSYTANLIDYFKKKKICIIGIQHGGGYLLQNYEAHHIHSDFNFCDKFLSYGSSKYLKNTKVLVTGCLRDQFYERNFKSKNLTKNYKDFMYIPNPIMSEYFYTINKPSYQKVKLQDEIINFLKNKKIRTVIKLPKNPSVCHYPFLVDKRITSDFLIKYEKIYKSIEKNNPKIIILDYFSTSIYECLYSKSEIILFIDKYNMPKPDVLKCLEKRIHILNEFKDFKSLVKKILNNEISKKNDNEFKKNFFSLKNEKQLKKLFN